jgi:ABC-type transport system involved in Fe-S cluster assembly fused permease/ATPase subunit
MKKKYQRTKEAQRDSISKYEKEESLIIIDALEEYFGDEDTDAKSFKMDLTDYAKRIGKSGVSIRVLLTTS